MFITSLCSCKNEFSNQDITNMFGNTSTNLTVGGKICKAGERIYFCSTSYQKFTNSIYSKDTVKSSTKNVKDFIRTPSELCVVGNNLFFKLTTGSSANSFLYRINSSGKNKKTIIEKNVSKYMIYNNRIYYTLEDYKDSGIYMCDFNGENDKKIVKNYVSEFVCFEDNIFYSNKKEIYSFNITTSQVTKLYKSKDTNNIYNLVINDHTLFFTSENTNNNGIYSLNLIDNTVDHLYTGFCAFVHIVDNNRLIFLNENNYCILNLKTKQTLDFLKEYDNISELYVFQSDIYFYTTEYLSDNIEEKLYYVNISEENYNPIVLS